MFCVHQQLTSSEGLFFFAQICALQATSMLMMFCEPLGLELDSLCVATVGKRQFKMTALDLAGHDPLKLFFRGPQRGISLTFLQLLPVTTQQFKLF